MSWIKTVPFEQASGKLRKLYDRVTGPGNNVDNIMMVHSLRPHSMEGHMVLYKNVLHHSANTIPKWFSRGAGRLGQRVEQMRVLCQTSLPRPATPFERPGTQPGHPLGD